MRSPVPAGTPPATKPPPPPPPGTVLYTGNGLIASAISLEQFAGSLASQLGLKLESAKGPVEVIVIDKIEKPSEN